MIKLLKNINLFKGSLNKFLKSNKRSTNISKINFNSIRKYLKSEDALIFSSNNFIIKFLENQKVVHENNIVFYSKKQNKTFVIEEHFINLAKEVHFAIAAEEYAKRIHEDDYLQAFDEIFKYDIPNPIIDLFITRVNRYLAKFYRKKETKYIEIKRTKRGILKEGYEQ